MDDLVDPVGRHRLTPAELVLVNRARDHADATLTWRDGEGALRVLGLAPGSRHVIGRRPAASVVVGWDPKVSGLHAEVESIGGEWILVDDGLSSNGTFVGDQRVNGRVRLRDGDRVRVGTTLIVFQRHDGTDASGATLTEIGTGPVFDELDRRILAELARDALLAGNPTPAGTEAISDAVHLGKDAVKQRLGAMYKRCDITAGDKRARLLAYVIEHGVITRRSYDEGRRE